MLEIVNLSKTYDSVPALNNVSFKLESGIYALLGPNGAGKSTLMNILALNIERDSGVILCDGTEILNMQTEYKQILGYMPQQQNIYENFTGAEFLSYFAALKGIERKLVRKEVKRVSKLVNLQNKLNQRLKGYSGGMKQRLLLATAIMGDPKLLILDEPTAGLDPKERIRTKTLIKSLSKDKIIIIATHVVSDVENIADGVILMKNGNVMMCDSPRVLVESIPGASSLEDVYMYVFAEGRKLL